MLGLSALAEPTVPNPWVARAQQGDRAAFEDMVRACQGRVLRTCLRLLGGSVEAQDVAQETFVKAFTHLDQLDPQRSPLPWLTTVATRLCLNRIRSRQRAREDELDEAFDAPVEEDWLRGEDQRRLQSALQRLPDNSRAVLVLFYLEEWSCKEIAEALGLSESNVKVLLHRGREKLRSLLC